MMCMIDGQSFCTFTKNTWFGNLGASCHIANYDAGMYDVTHINKLVQGSSGSMSATTKGKLHVKVRQINGSKRLHTLLLAKYCTVAGGYLFLLTCKILQGGKVSSDEKMISCLKLGWQFCLDC